MNAIPFNLDRGLPISYAPNAIVNNVLVETMWLVSDDMISNNVYLVTIRFFYLL